MDVRQRCRQSDFRACGFDVSRLPERRKAGEVHRVRKAEDSQKSGVIRKAAIGGREMTNGTDVESKTGSYRCPKSGAWRDNKNRPSVSKPSSFLESRRHKAVGGALSKTPKHFIQAVPKHVGRA